MPTLTSHYNAVLHHFVSTVCCVMAGVICPLSVCSRVYQCVLSAWCTTTVLPSPFHRGHCTPSKSLATVVCVPLSLPSHYHSTSPAPSACHTSLSHTCHCTLHSYPLHTQHTHSQHTYCTCDIVSLLCMQCVSLPLPPVHSSLHQSLSSPRLTCSRKRCCSKKRCIRSTRGSK